MPPSGSKRSTGSTRSIPRPDSAAESRRLGQRRMYFADSFLGFGENGGAVGRRHAQTQESVDAIGADASRLGCRVRFGENQTGDENIDQPRLMPPAAIEITLVSDRFTHLVRKAPTLQHRLSDRSLP